jgi:acyl-CoA thioesterase
MDNVRRLFLNDHFAHHCGIELLSVDPGRAAARMLLQPHHLNGLHSVQGGAIFTLADFAFAAAANSRGFVAVAANVSITFLKAASTGTLTAVAREIGSTRRLGSYTVEIRNEQDELIALFQGLAYRKSDKLPTEETSRAPDS